MGAGNSGPPPTSRRPSPRGPNNEAGENRTGGGNAERHDLRRMDGADTKPLASLSECSKHVLVKKSYERNTGFLSLFPCDEFSRRYRNITKLGSGGELISLLKLVRKLKLRITYVGNPELSGEGCL